MVVKPTVPKEDRDEVLHRACSRLSAKVTAYPACRPGLPVGHRWENDDMTHDPLCALSKAECRASQDARHSIVTNTAWCDACQDDCQCDLIAKVRADEQARQREEMTTLLLEARSHS